MELKAVANRNDLRVVNIYKEEQTALKPGRSYFNELLQRIENGEASAILVWELSRLSRNPLDTSILRWLMEGKGRLKEIRTKDKTYTDVDSFLMDIEFATANKESKQTSERTRRNLLYKAKEKKEWPGWAPIGYINIDKDTLVVANLVKNGQIDTHKQQIQILLEKKYKKEKRKPNRVEIDPIKGPLIKKMLEAFATGLYSLDAIVELINEWGLTNRSNNPLDRSVIANILANPFYCGMFIFKVLK